MCVSLGVICYPWYHNALLILHVLVAFHSKGLAGSGLAIGEDGRVIALDDLADHKRDVGLLEHL